MPWATGPCPAQGQWADMDWRPSPRRSNTTERPKPLQRTRDPPNLGFRRFAISVTVGNLLCVASNRLSSRDGMLGRESDLTLNAKRPRTGDADPQRNANMFEFGKRLGWRLTGGVVTIALGALAAAQAQRQDYVGDAA